MGEGCGLDEDAERLSACSGELSLGCKLCAQGAKMVLFVTGVCGKGCFYCPVSFARRGDQPFANERPVKSVEEVLEEAERTGAKGAGVTGGNPLARLERTCLYVSRLKEAFGQGFHIHVYLPEADERELLALDKAGVDEVRFHWGDPGKAAEFAWDVGGEVPVVPGWKERTKKFLDLLEKREATFCNLNELDISESNAAELGRRGLTRREARSFGVGGSEELAMEILKKKRALSIHYCSSAFKDAIQLRRRFIRTAARVAEGFEEVTDDGTVVSGVLEGKVDLEEPHYFWEGETFCAPEVARRMARERRAKIVEWVPTWDREVREVTPL